MLTNNPSQLLIICVDLSLTVSRVGMEWSEQDWSQHWQHYNYPFKQDHFLTWLSNPQHLKLQLLLNYIYHYCTIIVPLLYHSCNTCILVMYVITALVHFAPISLTQTVRGVVHEFENCSDKLFSLYYMIAHLFKSYIQVMLQIVIVTVCNFHQCVLIIQHNNTIW